MEYTTVYRDGFTEPRGTQHARGDSPSLPVADVLGRQAGRPGRFNPPETNITTLNLDGGRRQESAEKQMSDRPNRGTLIRPHDHPLRPGGGRRPAPPRGPARLRCKSRPPYLGTSPPSTPPPPKRHPASPPPSPPPTPPTPSGDKDGSSSSSSALSSGASIGIGVGIALGVVAIVGGAWVVIKSRRKKAKAKVELEGGQRGWGL